MLLAVVVQVGAPAAVSAAVGVQASLTETLYAPNGNPDCATLHALKNQGEVGDRTKELPFHVVRLRASVPGVPDDQVSFQWSVPKPAAGVLAADLDIGGAEAPAIQAICAEFGSACILTKEKLRFYTQPTILWIAPTCDILPAKTAKQYRGGQARFRVKARSGKRKFGKGSVTVGFGRVGNVVLFADGKDGIGKPSGVPGGVRFIFSARADDLGQAFPKEQGFTFDNGAGSTAEGEPCSLGGRDYDSCAGFRGELDYHAAGRYTALVHQQFDDRSELCDNITVQVLECAARGEVQIVRSPRVQTYVPGNARTGTVDVVIRLRNRSIAEHGLPPCGFLLPTGNVLTCDEEARFGGGTDNKSTTFDLTHCSETTDLCCADDGQCPNGEKCLTAPHCSKSIMRACQRDGDCEKPTCNDCEDGETCTRVLALGCNFFVEPGQTRDLLRLDDVPLINVLPDTTSVTDTWTATTVNAGSYDGTDKYRIKGQPNVPPR